MSLKKLSAIKTRSFKSFPDHLFSENNMLNPFFQKRSMRPVDFKKDLRPFPFISTVEPYPATTSINRRALHTLKFCC